MTTGINVPVTVGQHGGANTIDDSSQLSKILRLALSENDDENPFQDVGILASMIFNVNDPSTHAIAKQRVRRILSKFSDRLALSPGTDLKVSVNAEGEMTVEFEYVDLENGETSKFSETV